MITKQRLSEVAILLWMIFSPIHAAMAVVFILPLVDLILALLCARKARRPIQSESLKRTIAKILVYEIATVLAFLTEAFMTGPVVPAIKIVTGLIGVVELKSCLEHLDELGGQPLFASILTRLAPPQPPEPPTGE